MKNTLCIYHHPCADGFAAATVVRHALGYDRVECMPANYGMPAPNVTDRDVLIVDFSYPRETLLQMAEQAASITVLDHHQTARDQLVDLPANVCAVFDMRRSGAMLAWDWCHPGEAPPHVLAHVQDRDLWRFDMDGTREVMAALYSYPYDFDVWEDLLFGDTYHLQLAGTAIDRAQQKMIAEHIRAKAYFAHVAGYYVPVLCAPHAWASDAGNILAGGEPFAAIYCDSENRRHFSLRSDADGVDVAHIAQLFGGGGHTHAAGFSVLIPPDEIPIVPHAFGDVLADAIGER